MAEVAEEWGVTQRLGRLAHMERAYADCLDGAVEGDGRAAVQAGKAWPSERRIILHAELLKPGREDDRNGTFLHECAHVIVDRHYGKACRHGPLWRAAMVALGELPVPYHDIPYLSREAHASVIWECEACGETYPFVRKPRRRIRDCYCRHCGPRRGILRERLPEEV